MAGESGIASLSGEGAKRVGVVSFYWLSLHRVPNGPNRLTRSPRLDLDGS